MTVSLGYLLPTRERVMAGQHGTGPILALADRAADLGFDSVWIGDSLLAKPRHDPLTLCAAIAARTPKIQVGTAVLLSAMRNPVLLAHQVATLDQISEGRFILGVGIANKQPETQAEFKAAGVTFEKRIGTMMEGLRLCKALWTGEKVNWDGRWTVRDGVLGPLPWRKGGPPIWGGGSAPGALRRAGRDFDGWFPSGPADPAVWARNWAEVHRHAEEAGRDPGAITGAAYLTLSIDDDAARANTRLDAFLEQYYGQSATVLRGYQGCFAGSRAEAVAWLRAFVEGGATHLVLRFTGDHERNMETAASMRAEISG